MRLIQASHDRLYRRIGSTESNRDTQIQVPQNIEAPQEQRKA